MANTKNGTTILLLINNLTQVVNKFFINPLSLSCPLLNFFRIVFNEFAFSQNNTLETLDLKITFSAVVNILINQLSPALPSIFQGSPSFLKLVHSFILRRNAAKFPIKVLVLVLISVFDTASSSSHNF